MIEGKEKLPQDLILDVNDIEIYHELNRIIWANLAKHKTPYKLLLGDYMEDFNDVLKSDPDMEAVKRIAETCNVKIDLDDYKKLAELPLIEASALIDKGKCHAITGSFFKSLSLNRYEVENIINTIESGSPVTIIEEFFLVDGLTNPLFLENELQLRNVIDECYNSLKTLCEAVLTDPYADGEFFLETESKEFQKLFGSEKPSDNWGYLTNRLSCTLEDIENIWRLRFDVIDGAYKKTYVNFDDDKRFGYGQILGIKKYIEFLKTKTTHIPSASIVRTRDKKIDNRILLDDAAMNYVESCFMELVRDIKGHYTVESIMDEGEVWHFLKSNFQNYEDILPLKKIVVRMPNKTHLSYFIGQVLKPLVDRKDCFINLDMISALMKNNFHEFESDADEAIKKALQRHSGTPIHLLKSVKEFKEKLTN